MPNESNHESRITTLEQARKELEDALLVTAHLQVRQSQLLTEQAEYLASHEKRLRESEAHNHDLDKRIADLVSAIGEWIRLSKPQ